MFDHGSYGGLAYISYNVLSYEDGDEITIIEQFQPTSDLNSLDDAADSGEPEINEEDGADILE